jgi:glycosyltransferase involved in cell wall biosynthesis
MSSSSQLELPGQTPQESRTRALAAGRPPEATVVFAVRHASDRTRRAARLLLDHCRLNATELVIVTAGRAGDLFVFSSVSKLDDGVRVIEGLPDSDYATLRETGLRNSSGDIVTFIEDGAVGQSDLLECIGPRLPRTADDAPRYTAGVLSVVIPANNAASTLGTVLAAIGASDLRRDRYEVVVVDDASADESSLISARLADRLVRLRSEKPFGPAYARNRGVEFARGEYVVFIDADVCVHADALRRFAEVLDQNAGVGAVLGSYDATAADPRLVSQYRNLLYHFFHQRSTGDARAFWAGCGAVRTSVFMKAGMYDEWRFPRPQIEDIDLGHRILDLGFRITLSPEIQACHLRCWTMREIVATDFRDRAIPWMRVMSQRVPRTRSRGFGLRAVERISTLLIWAALGCLVAGIALHERLWEYLALASFTALAVQERDQLAFFRRERGLAFALAALALDALYFFMNGAALALGWLLRETFGDPAPSPRVEAFAEVGVRTWPPVHAKSER